MAKLTLTIYGGITNRMWFEKTDDNFQLQQKMYSPDKLRWQMAGFVALLCTCRNFIRKKNRIIAYISLFLCNFAIGINNNHLKI